MRAKFSRSFTYVPDAAPASSKTYPEGYDGPVTRECFEKAKAAGAAVASKRKERDADAGRTAS